MLKIKNKKGVLGLETVSAVIILLLVLAVIAVASFLALDALLNSGAISTTRTVNNFAGFTNDSFVLNETPTQPATVSGLFGVNYSDLIVVNASDDNLTLSGNFTINLDGAFATVLSGENNGSTISVTASAFTNTVDSDSKVLVSNVTNGTTEFFTSVPTIMTILGAVVIILAVVLIILAVGRISGGASAADLGGGGGGGDSTGL